MCRDVHVKGVLMFQVYKTRRKFNKSQVGNLAERVWILESEIGVVGQIFTEGEKCQECCQMLFVMMRSIKWRISF